MIPWTAARQASLSSTISQSLFKLMSIERVMPSNHPFFLPSIFPRIMVFSSESVTSGGQSTGASALVLPMNIQRSFPLGLTGLISLLSKGLSRVFSSSQFKSINSSAFSLLYGPTLTSVHDYWKNHRFDYMDICQQSDVSA